MVFVWTDEDHRPTLEESGPENCIPHPPAGNPKIQSLDQLVNPAVAPEPQKRTTSSSVPPTALWMIARASSRNVWSADLSPGFRVGICVQGENLTLDEVLDKGKRPAACCIVCVGQTPRPIGARYYLFIAN